MKHIMKQVLIKSILIAMVLPFLAQAQPTRLTRFPMGKTVTKTIERELDFPTSISYIELGTDHYFVYYNGNDTLKMVPISSAIAVNDFVILDNMVYFCGTDNAMGGGFFGWFEIHPFFNINQAYEVTNAPMFSQNGNLVVSLQKMVAFWQNSTLELVAVGQTLAANSCVVELQYAPSTYTCCVGELTTSINERILDITLTDNYVVTAGVGTLGYSFPCVRVYNRNNVFSGLGDEVTCIVDFWYYSYNPTQQHRLDFVFDMRQIVLSSVENDFFFMAGYWRSPSGQYVTTPRGLYVAAYQVSLGNWSNITQSTGARIDQNFLNGYWKLRGMTSLETTTDLDAPFYILQEAEHDYTLPNESMVYQLSYNQLVPNPPASPSFFYPPYSIVPIKYSLDTKYLSIDGFHDNSQYVMNGYSLNDNQSLMFYEQYPMPGGYCLQDAGINCYNTKEDQKKEYVPFDVDTMLMTTASMIGGKPEIVVGTVQCLSKDVEPQNMEER